MRLVLCSSSQPRKLLLERLQIPFEIDSPDVDETPLPNESARDLVLRLAKAKAQVHQAKYPNALLIGCDQVASIDHHILGKPNSHQQAIAQLEQCSGRKVEFLVGLALYSTATHQLQTSIEATETQYRSLTRAMIENYLRREQPYQCAGSVKGESLGIALFERVTSDDPTALIGLPLIQLQKMLAQEGISVI